MKSFLFYPVGLNKDCVLPTRFKKELDRDYFIATYQSKNLTHRVKIFTPSESKAKKEAEKLLIKPFELVSLERVFISNNKQNEFKDK